MSAEQLIQKYQTELKKMISNEDFHRMIPNVDGNIIKYTDLQNYPSIYDLLPGPETFKIILIESKRNQGHWVCILRYNDSITKKDTIEFFDPYGGGPDGELSFIPETMRRMLGEGRKLLAPLIRTKNDNTNFVYNKKRLQELNNEVCTCGRWSTLRIWCMQLRGMDLEQFQQFLERQSKRLKKPYDILVCDWVV